MNWPHYQFQQGLFPIKNEPLHAAILHFQSCRPKEGVGVVIGGLYHPLKNVASNPVDYFKVDLDQYNEVVATYGPVECVLHSHPQNQRAPSAEDMESQIAMRVPFGIVAFHDIGPSDIFFWGDGVRIAPYIGRPFKHGVYDCYALVRDWFMQEHGIALGQFARNDGWWNDPKEPDLLADNVRNEGFEEIEFKNLRYGDVVLIQILGSRKLSHCGVIMQDGTLLHHPYGTSNSPRYSLRDNLYSWKNRIRHCVRYSKATLHAPTS